MDGNDKTSKLHGPTHLSLASKAYKEIRCVESFILVNKSIDSFVMFTPYLSTRKAVASLCRRMQTGHPFVRLCPSELQRDASAEQSRDTGALRRLRPRALVAQSEMLL